MSYTLAYTGTQIDNILGRSAPNGEFDGYFADINDKLDKLNIVTTSDDYATVQAYVQNNVAVALSDGGKFYVYTGEYDGNYYFACVTQGSSDTTDAVFEVAYIDSGNNWSVGGWSSLAPVFSPNFTGNPTAPTPIQSSNNTKIATTAFVHTAVDPVSNAALNAYPTDTASGDVVSITDGASNIPVKAFAGSIIPQQNLNGQSAPYPAGCGKNKLQITATTQTINGVTITVNADGSIKVNGTTTAQTILPISDLLTPLATGNPVILNGCPSGGSTSTYCLDTGYNAYVDSGSGVTLGDAQLSGQRVRLRLANGQTFNNMMFYPMIRLATVTDATFAPYSNVCPISGWTGANITHEGRNIYNPNASWSLSSAYRYVNGIVPKQVSARMVFKDKDTTVDVSGASIGFVYDDLGSTTPHTYRWVMQNGNIKADTTNIPNAGDTGVYCQNLMIYPRTSAIYTAVFSRWDIMVEIGVESADYEPYTADTILLSFGQTVYAGTLTALGGGLWQVQPTHALTTLSALSWSKTANGIFASALQARAKGQGIFPFISDTYKQYTGAHSTSSNIASLVAANGDGIYVNAGSASFYVADARYTDADAFKSDMGSVVFVYELATYPDPITITGEDLQTLLGANTVWTDCGSVTGMTYRADTTLYIDKKLGA